MAAEAQYNFSDALAFIKAGESMRRLGWERAVTRHQKYKIALSPIRGFRTWYLNYSSDNGVLSADDILADDWVKAED